MAQVSTQHAGGIVGAAGEPGPELGCLCQPGAASEVSLAGRLCGRADRCPLRAGLAGFLR